MFKRNDIVVMKRDDSFYAPYCRVNKVFPETKEVEIISNMKDYEILKFDEVELHNDYKGYYDSYQKVFIRMPSLRKMKQTASCYHPEVFIKNRNRKKWTNFYHKGR